MNVTLNTKLQNFYLIPDSRFPIPDSRFPIVIGIFYRDFLSGFFIGIFYRDFLSGFFIGIDCTLVTTICHSTVVTPYWVNFATWQAQIELIFTDFFPGKVLDLSFSVSICLCGSNISVNTTIRINQSPIHQTHFHQSHFSFPL